MHGATSSRSSSSARLKKRGCRARACSSARWTRSPTRRCQRRRHASKEWTRGERKADRDVRGPQLPRLCPQQLPASPRASPQELARRQVLERDRVRRLERARPRRALLGAAELFAARRLAAARVATDDRLVAPRARRHSRDAGRR